MLHRRDEVGECDGAGARVLRVLVLTVLTVLRVQGC